MPLFDDRHGIGPCLDAIRAQTEATSHVERILVVDGGSTDGSREAVNELAAKDARVVLLDNHDRFVPYALNLAIGQAESPVIVRVDSHAVIAPDYVDAAVDALHRTGADVVGGAMSPVGDTPTGEAVAWALTSRWGIGGSRFHLEGAAGETDSVYMGVFPRTTFERFGRFDERFSRNQDDEFTYRVREQGGRVVPRPRDPLDVHATRRLRGPVPPVPRVRPVQAAGPPNAPGGLRLRHLAPPLVAVGVARRSRWASPGSASS